MIRTFSRTLSFAVGITLLVGCEAPPAEQPEEELQAIDLSGGPAFPLEAHLESEDLAEGAMSFEEMLEAGAKLFHTPYNGHDGVGAKLLPDGSPINRFSIFPPGGGHTIPMSSQSCGSCHRRAASGPANSHVMFDGDRDGKPPFNIRSTTSLLGNGLLQLLAQEITEDLQGIREAAGEAAKASPGKAVQRELTSKGVAYGTIVATANAAGEVSFDVSGRQGVDPDLVVRPLGWKGNITIIRTITFGPAAGLMGMQAEEIILKIPSEGEPVTDPDGDGVERELSVGDITAMVVYGAAQETPQSVQRLAELAYVAPPTEADLAKIARGRETFDGAGCASCHTPEMHLENTVFEEPTLRGNGNYYDPALADLDSGYDTERPVTFDLAAVAEEPRVETDPEGGAIVRLFGDLKRHQMGRQLADPAGPTPAIKASATPLMDGEQLVLIAPSEFLTPELWGVGNTGPWMHDGRAATLEEAILWHGEDDPPAAGDPERSEAQESRDAYTGLAVEDQEALLTFLRSLRTFIPPRS